MAFSRDFQVFLFDVSLDFSHFQSTSKISVPIETDICKLDIFPTISIFFFRPNKPFCKLRNQKENKRFYLKELLTANSYLNQFGSKTDSVALRLLDPRRNQNIIKSKCTIKLLNHMLAGRQDVERKPSRGKSIDLLIKTIKFPSERFDVFSQLINCIKNFVYSILNLFTETLA